MVTTAMYEWSTLVDRKDKLQNIHDPESEYGKAGRMAIARSTDDVLVAAALGTAASGEDGSTATALGNAQKIAAVSGGAISAGNVNSLLEAKHLFDQAEVIGMRYFVHNASFLRGLLGQTQVTSADFNTVKALVQGEIDTYLGFKFIHIERLPVANSAGIAFDANTGLYSASGAASQGGTEVSNFAFVGDGLLLGKNQEAFGRVTERDDMSFSNQVYVSMDFGGVRMEEVKVVEVIALP